MTRWIQSEDFTFGSNTLITDVHFRCIVDNSVGTYLGSIAWFIYDDSAGSPGGVLSNGTATTPLITIGPASDPTFTEYELDFFIHPFNFIGGARYWLGLHNGALTNQTDSGFFWEFASGGLGATGHELIAPFSGSWSDNSRQHYFQLTNDAVVPETSSMVLVASGLAALISLVRRARG